MSTAEGPGLQRRTGWQLQWPGARWHLPSSASTAAAGLHGRTLPPLSPWSIALGQVRRARSPDGVRWRAREGRATAAGGACAGVIVRVGGRGAQITASAATARVWIRRAVVDADVWCPWAWGGVGAGSSRMPGKTRSTRRRWPQSSSAPCSSPSSLAQVCCRRRSCSAQAACARGTGEGDAPSHGACFSRAGRGIWLDGSQLEGSWPS